jgi:large subunit ribosomal protein L4
MRLPMCDATGRAVDAIEVSDGLFGVPMNQALVHQVAVSHMANARQGTAATKTRGMVSGGGAKPWRQKHTGRARQGSTRSPQWRGGGVVFGPHPRDYTQRIPKKMNRGAIRCILSQKARDEKLLIVKDIQLAQAKTKEMTKLLSNLGVTSPALIVTSAPQKDVIVSARNLGRVKTLPAPQLNALDLLHHDRVVMTEDAVRRAESLWALETFAAVTDAEVEPAVDEASDEAAEMAATESEENAPDAEVVEETPVEEADEEREE